MSVVSVNARSFILALFIRDDGERFLLGDNGYDFKGSQLHFSANTIENDEVMKQGADGVMVAGQVRRASVQSFDGYVGDATMAKETIEQMRRDFFAFFVKGHHFRVVYIDCNRNAWQRKGGYLVDAPEVKELWQIHPEYHVGLNFEDVNYYSYDEDADGEEILSNLIDVPVSTAASGGLVWDEDGAVSEDAEVEYDTETAGAAGKAISISDAAEAPLSAFKLDGETSQNGTPTPSAPVSVNTTTGENVVKICGKNLLDAEAVEETDRGIIFGMTSSGNVSLSGKTTTTYAISAKATATLSAGTYTLSIDKALAFGFGLATYSSGTRTTHYIAAGSKSLTFTLSSAADGYDIYIAGISANTDVDEVLKAQLELGSTATAYEPYQGQSYEVNLGKNLFDKTTATLNYRIGSDGSPYGDNNYFLSEFIPVNPNTQYRITPVSVGGSSAIAYYDSSKTFISRTMGGTWYDASTPANCAYIRFTTLKTLIDSTQCELGSQATSYAAYFEPIELCKIGDYQDYIYKSEDKWYVHKEVGSYQFDGSEAWSRSGQTTSSVFVAVITTLGNYIKIPLDNTIKSLSMSDHFVYNNQTGNGVGRFSAYNGTTFCTALALSFDITTIPDIAAAKAWITANKPAVYAPILTPTDTEITNQALIAQLDALLTTARTYVGINNIFTITPNEQGTLEVGYYTKYQPIVTGGGYVWEAGGAGGATIVVNNSIDNVNPIWKIYGPTMNPQLENSTTGEVIEYVGLVAEGQTLTIDMGEQTASLDGLNVISNLVGDFVSLAPGANRLIYSVSGDAGASEIGWSEIVG